jgi:hypothetical protein
MLESFLDPLGKPMQIHEITRRRINEAGIMGQIGSNIATGLANKLLPGSVPADQFVGSPTSANQRQAAAGQMNRSLLAPLAKQMQQRWAQAVQQLVSTSKSVADPKIPATGADQLAPAELTQEFEKFLNSLFAPNIDIAGLAALSDNNDARMLSQQLPVQIQSAIDVTMDPKTNAGKANKTWMDLATSVQRAKSIAQFSGARRTASSRVNPQAQKVADELDLDANQVAQMQQMARDPASLAALQQLIGMKK